MKKQRKVQAVNDNLSFTMKPAGNALVVSAVGRIDSSTAGQFEDQMDAVFAQAPQALVIDLEQVDYMSSAGLRVLLMAAKRTKAERSRLVLCAMSPGIREVFDISGFSAIFDIVDTVEAAEAKAQS